MRTESILQSPIFQPVPPSRKKWKWKKPTKVKKILRLGRSKKRYTPKQIASIADTTVGYVWHTLSRNGIQTNRPPSTLRTTNCIHCGKEFQHTFTRFCTRECYSAHHLPEVSCDECGRKFRKRLDRIKRTKHNFHNLTCYFKWKRKRDALKKERKGNEYDESI